MKLWTLSWKCEHCHESVNIVMIVWTFTWKCEHWHGSVNIIMIVWTLSWNCEHCDAIISSVMKFWTVSWNWDYGHEILNSVMKLKFPEIVFWLVLSTLIVSLFVRLFVFQSVILHLKNSSKPHVKMFPLNTINIDHYKPFSFIPYISSYIILSTQKCAVMCLSLCILQLIHDINRTELISVDEGGQVHTVWTAGLNATNSYFFTFLFGEGVGGVIFQYFHSAT